MKSPGQYILGYAQAFVEARATEADKPHMERLLAEARHLVAQKR